MWCCFLMSGVKILHFLKDWWKSIPIHQNYTMALRFLEYITYYFHGWLSSIYILEETVTKITTILLIGNIQIYIFTQHIADIFKRWWHTVQSINEI